MTKYKLLFLAVPAFACVLFAFQNCSEGFQVSQAESKALFSEEIFRAAGEYAPSAASDPFDIHSVVDGLRNPGDTIPLRNPLARDTNLVDGYFVQDCAKPGLYEQEKAAALAAAKADPTGATIPVKYSYSIGRKHDIVARYAHDRAILSDSNPGYTVVPVGPKNHHMYNNRHTYYKANHDKAKADYVNGRNCFFNTISVDPSSLWRSTDYYDFIKVTAAEMQGITVPARWSASKYGRHMVHYMHYGWCRNGLCSKEAGFADYYANRLFKTIPSIDSNGDHQIIKLYVADIRSEQAEIDDIIRVDESVSRGEEINLKTKEMVNVCGIHQKYNQLVRNFGDDVTVGVHRFSGMSGVPQLLHNLLSMDLTLTSLSAQYTPIVLDLGKPGIATSSVRWGTYFNMGALKNVDKLGDPEEMYVPHRTAWLGGDYMNQSHLISDGRSYPIDVRATADDGLLVIPDADGKVRSSKNLFGDNMEVNGQTYDNGFLALQALANKDCNSAEIRKRYFGPWDGALYTDIVKVWVDANRNGLAEPGEISSLKDKNVVAINACNIVHAEATDAHGNGSHLRSAFLLQKADEDISGDFAEIETRLTSGKCGTGCLAQFRVAIDMIFSVDKSKMCDDFNVQ